MEGTFFGKVIKILSTDYMQFITGALVTLLIAISATIIGFFIGILVGVVKTIPPKREEKLFNGFLKFCHIIINIYVEVFRGTPMIVQATVLYYGLTPFFKSSFGIEFNPIVAGIVTVSINTGAYLAEVVRGGIESIDKGQTEAAQAIGMNHTQTMFCIILPQAIRNIMPALGNEFIINIKDTSVLNVISVTELYFTSKSVAGKYFLTFETFFITASIYLFLTISISSILRHVERKIDGNKTFVLHSSTMHNNS